MACYRVELTRSAEKDLRRIDRSRVPEIIKSIEGLADQPRPQGVSKLSGTEHTYRIRIGVYRVVYEIKDSVLLVSVIRIGHRSDVYRS